MKALASEKCDSKIIIFVWTGSKHCGKRRKCRLPAYSHFPTMISKAVYVWVVWIVWQRVDPLPHNAAF